MVAGCVCLWRLETTDIHLFIAISKPTNIISKNFTHHGFMYLSNALKWTVIVIQLLQTPNSTMSKKSVHKLLNPYMLLLSHS